MISRIQKFKKSVSRIPISHISLLFKVASTYSTLLIFGAKDNEITPAPFGAGQDFVIPEWIQVDLDVGYMPRSRGATDMDDEINFVI